MNLSNYFKPWTQEEIDYLTENYPIKRTEWIAEYMGRTPTSIVERAKLHGLKKLRSNKGSKKK